jgi:hypothetical protein
MEAVLRAQEMAGNRLNAADAAKELASLRGILQEDQNGSQQTSNGQNFTFAYTVMMLTDLQRMFPNNTLFKKTAEEYIRYDKSLLSTDGTFFYWYNVAQNPQPYNAHFIQVYQQALAGVPFSDWSTQTGNQTAFTLGLDASNYIMNYGGGIFWANPDPTQYYADPPVFYVGHTLAYTTALLAILSDARARYQVNASDPTVRVEVKFARDGYEFMKRRGGMGLMGNFGVSSTLGIMLQLAVQLEHFRFIYPDLIPLSTYYEDAERWTRNTAAEMRVDAATAAYIPNTTGAGPEFDNLGSRAAGTFLSDATHAVTIPTFDFMDDNDGLWLMRGLYDVWKSTVEVTTSGTVAWVNLLLNNASQYMDIYSDLPYRGLVRVQLRGDIGSISELAVRIPAWAGQTVTIVEGKNGTVQTLPQGSRWSWNGAYVVIYPVSAGATYQVRFPMAVQHLSFDQLRSQTSHWHEEDYGPDALPGRAGVTTFNGTYLGDTLVSVDQRPAGGIPRYQRQNWASQISGNTAIEVAPPMKTVTRFVMGLAP